MKKMRKYGWGMVMPVVWAACVLGSCKNEVDDVFDQDATSRIEAAITECDNMLQSSEFGWRFDYTPTNSAMVNYVMRFKDGRVTMDNAGVPVGDRQGRRVRVRGVSGDGRYDLCAGTQIGK